MSEVGWMRGGGGEGDLGAFVPALNLFFFLIKHLTLKYLRVATGVYTFGWSDQRYFSTKKKKISTFAY